MENFNQISIFLTQSARDSVNYRFEDNEKLRELLKGYSQFVNIILNGPIGLKEFIEWESNVYRILESMGACNVNVAIDAYEKDSYAVGAENKIVSASFSIEYRMKNNNELSYDNNC